MKHLKYFLLIVASIATLSIPLSAQEEVMPISTEMAITSSNSAVLVAEDASMEADVHIGDSLMEFLDGTGFAMIGRNWKLLVMLLISFLLLYLAIVKKFEPLLLLPIAFGMMLTNLPGSGLFTPELFADGIVHWEQFSNAGLLDYQYLGLKLGIHPCIIFIGVGAMSDVGPLKLVFLLPI